ncbi:hypothetical protein [Teredinibacter waterburyi]|uniref:hypothetical protein n=1 Tax=Teredinibacter waterburyi TaxID=1500538 RepID=UPI00165FA9B3|nr:hypothetical protein [Teredinibacter waterburyi]
MSGSIKFGSSASEVSKINYSVPLPGRHQGKRLVRLDLQLEESDWLASEFNDVLKPAAAAGIVHNIEDGSVSIDPKVSAGFLFKKLSRLGFPAGDIDKALSSLPALIDGTSPPEPPPELDPDTPPNPFPDKLQHFVHQFVAGAKMGKVTSPVPGPGGEETVAEVPVDQEPAPALFLVEKVAISSFLGDYGMGKTVKTFTLLPGESTTIRIKTWQSTKQSKKDSSSIIDSHQDEAKQRFENTVQSETTDKTTKSKEEKWSVEAEADATWGWGSASIKASASGEYQSGREQFSKQVSSAVGEHSKSASSKRELSITSESEVSVEEGSEEVIERTISNVNVRRVLNFVFRELNQEYTTHVHLTDIHVAYSNGMDGSWRQVPISGLLGLLREVLSEDKIPKIAQQILKVASVVFSHDDIPVQSLELIKYSPQDDSFSVSPVPKDQNGMPAPPTETAFYRFKQGALGQNEVDGVLLSTQQIVMRTDSVIVEALLGEADALDEYAMEIQAAASTKQTLENKREELLQQTLGAIADPIERAKLAATLFSIPLEQ